MVLGEDAHVLLRCLQTAFDSLRPSASGGHVLEVVLPDADGKTLQRALDRLEAQGGPTTSDPGVLPHLLLQVLAALDAAGC
ncbi:MAG: hypothetical protein JWM64_2331 [Frankiales bacterium]|nr:hypothetical protein [Frankiales bacterium]